MNPTGKFCPEPSQVHLVCMFPVQKLSWLTHPASINVSKNPTAHKAFGILAPHPQPFYVNRSTPSTEFILIFLTL